MALVKYTAAVAEIRGKLNGNVFSRNTYGSYLRNKVTPINPSTTYQAFIRNILTSASQAWGALTAADRASWEALSKQVSRKNIFGDEVKLTGFNLFVRLYSNTQKVGGSTISAAPASLSVAALTTLSFDPDNNAVTLAVTFAPTPVPAGTVLYLDATPCVSPGVTFVKPEYRNIAVVAGATATGYDAYDDYVARFGEMITGKAIFMRARFIVTTTGAESGILSYKAVVHE